MSTQSRVMSRAELWNSNDIAGTARVSPLSTSTSKPSDVDLHELRGSVAVDQAVEYRNVDHDRSGAPLVRLGVVDPRDPLGGQLRVDVADAEVQLGTPRLGADRCTEHGESRGTQPALHAPAEGRVRLDRDHAGPEGEKRLGPGSDVRADVEGESSVRDERPEELTISAT